MWQRDPGLTRRQIREGSGTYVEKAHFDEVLGSSEFYVYVTPNKKAKGYEALKKYLEAEGCETGLTTESPVRMDDRYQIVRITHQGQVIPDSPLRRAHRWAHQRNYLHSFFRPVGNAPNLSS